MVLEVSISTVRRGKFRDVLAAGGSFASGGYDGRLVNGTGRQGWINTSDGQRNVTVNLPAAARGATVRFRFREVTDRSRASAGATLDNVRVTATAAGGPATGPGVDRVIDATPGNDDIRLLDAPGGKIDVQVNGQSRGLFSPADRLILHAGDGDDTIENASANAKYVFAFGGNGRDTLTGGTGDDVLVGGVGDDRLYGRAGRDVLIGGHGSDALDGGDGDDLLVSGFTTHDDDLQALAAIRAEWSRPDANYETRLAQLPLNAQTVFGNGQSPDTMRGASGRDAFFFDAATAQDGHQDIPLDRAEDESAILISF